MKKYILHRVSITKDVSDYIESVIKIVENGFVTHFFEVNKKIFIVYITRAICIHFLVDIYGSFFCRSPPVDLMFSNFELIGGFLFEKFRI